MRKIKVYTGTGAYQARDVENFLAVFDYAFERLHESKFGTLTARDALIVPGGRVSAYLPAWGKSGIAYIKRFVSGGGIYVGICAGAYVAGARFRGNAGLGFFPGELRYNRGHRIISARDARGRSWQLISENGPSLSRIEGGSVMLKDTHAKPQAVEIYYGKGRVYLFASHPEGSVAYRRLPQNFSGARFFDRFLRRL